MHPERFEDIHALAIECRGGAEEVERRLLAPRTPEELRSTSDDRWLAGMTRCVFQAGFNWALIDEKWPGFESAFEGFDVHRWSLMSDDDLDRLLATPGVVAHAGKIRSVGANAALLAEVVGSHGSAGAFFASWPAEAHMDLLLWLRKRGSRLGGRTGQVFLRRMGVDSLVFAPDVVRALVRAGVVAGPPSSAADLRAVQRALDRWRSESGRPLTQISQILAMSVGPG